MDDSNILIKIIGFLLTVVGFWTGFYVRRLSTAVDNLADGIGDLKEHVAESYVSKNDCRDIRANCPAKVKK